MLPNLEYESAFWRDGYRYVAGLDEVGRGAWAGPVVAGAVIFPAVGVKTARAWARSRKFRPIKQVNDSKQLTPMLREELYDPIRSCAIGCATASASHEEIDALGIVRATRLAMLRALEALPIPPGALLIDAFVLPELEIPQEGIVHGDAISLSIAAASILAKVTRDRLMRELDVTLPGYNFARHKGYGTVEHSAALRKCGASPVHRRSYAPISRLLESE